MHGLQTRSHDSHGVDCVFVWQDVQVLNAERVRDLDTLLQTEDITSSFLEKFGGHGKCDYGDVFWLCNRFTTQGVRFFQKKNLFLFTNEENPFGNNLQHRNALKNVEDLRNRGTRVNVLYMAEENRLVNLDAWKEIDPDVEQSSNMEELENDIRRKKFALRTVASLPFRLSDDLELSIGVYYLIVPQTKPPARLLDSETNEEVIRKTDYINQSTGEKVLPSDLHKASVVAGERIVVASDEREAIRRISPPGLVLLGFKPQACLKLTHHMKPSQFIFPREDLTAGSTRLYRALYERCLNRGQVIIARYTQKTNTAPHLVALVPQPGPPQSASLVKVESANVTDAYRYAGFHLVTLPFAEDKRSLDEHMRPLDADGQWATASEMQVQRARAFVNALTGPYCPDQFTNPVLQRHYRVLEALALARDDGELPEIDVPDMIQPYFANADPSLASRGREQLNAFCNAVFPIDYDGSNSKKKTTATSRRRNVNDREDDATTAKRGKSAVKTEDVDLPALASQNKLATLTVAELRVQAARCGVALRASMKKEEIVKAITMHFL